MRKIKKIDKKNSIIYTEIYPSISKIKYNNNIVLLGLGGNMGDSVRLFHKLFYFFKKSSLLCILESSIILKNPPFGYLNQSYFYNTTLLISTKLSPKELLRYILKVEKYFGRVREFQDGPRTLDIDIILYNNISIKSPKLTIPHPKYGQRDSVQIPMNKMKGLR
jgi:2-amino-4-hydroxy-6-hydroxymethyldihydropteridine diphosphokinase